MSKNTVLNTYNFVSTSDRQLQLDSNQYELIIRQQPKQARLCSSKERDRRPVDPPPIIQLKVDGYGDEAQNFLQSPYYFMCANLVHPTDNGESFTVSSRYLAGTVVSSLHKLKDIDNKDGGFFVFGDVSVRIEGRYRLRFSLFEIIRDEVVHIQSAISDVFTVYSPKAFPGMSESTFLSRSFSDQGVRIRIRKEHRIQMKRPQSNNNKQSDTAECDDDNLNDDGNMDIPIKRKRSKSQTMSATESIHPTPPSMEMFDTTSPYYPSSQQSQYESSLHSSYTQHHQYTSRQRQGGGSLSYPPPLGYPQQQYNPPQRQNSYYEDSEYDSSSLPYYEHHEQSMLNKRPRLSNSEMIPYDYRQPSSTPPLNNNQFTTSHNHYNATSPPPPPPPHSSSSYRTPRRGITLSPLLEHQPSYATFSTKTSSHHNPSLPPTRHRSFDILTSAASSNTTSLDSSFHYAETAMTPSTSLQRSPQPISPSEPFYRPPSSSSSTQSFPPKPPVRSRTLPLSYMSRSDNNFNNNNSNNNNDHNNHHQTTASLLSSSSSNQLPTPKTSIDVDGIHNHNKKQFYPPTPPNLNSVDSYKNGNNNNSNNSSSLTPSFTQHFTLSPRPGPLQLPSKSPLSNNNNGLTKTSSLPIMSSNSNTSSSSNTTLTFLNNGDVLTSSPQLLPINNTRLPPITTLTDGIDFLINKKKDNYYNDNVQHEVTAQKYYHHQSADDSLTYNWHNNGGINDRNYEY